ncbi:MAG: glycoside hydrolase family 3 C-terminal domain-containing protein, partial [Clostridia bacterium]|nr:glycoside hydrolase family 3 C-terminal domain-containing protein [Clostridia bacterium]
MKTPKELVAEMTLEEKCSLLSGSDFWHTQAIDRLGIPAVMLSDGPHGLRKQNDKADHLGVNESIKAVCFPAACASTASFDRTLVRRIGETIGDECQHEQVAVNLGPAINIKRSPRCGRNFEYMSEDPFLAGELASSLIQGTQSKHIGVSVKHFAANNQEHRRMSSDSVIDERTLREIYLPAFEAAAKKGKAWTFMCSYNKLNGEYASQHEELLTDILRKEWGFDGYVMSDWGAVSDRVRGVHAGLDLEMPGSGGVNDNLVLEAVKRGDLDEKDVDTCVERILTITKRYLDNAKPDTPWDLEKDHALAGTLAADCMVLLKNEDSILPFRPEEKVLVIGEFAVRPRFQGGGSSHINCSSVTSLMDALKDVPGVSYCQGYAIKDDQPSAALTEEALEAAKHADKVLIVAGLPDSFESEGYDREHMHIPYAQEQLISQVAKVNPNTVVLLYNGSPVEMPWVNEVKGIVEGYLAGQNVGYANRAVLYGEVNPSGRLPETFPVHLEDTPCYLSYGGEGNTAVYSEGVFVGYRYYTTKKQPVLFPFGHGLSYTRFSYSDLTLSADAIKDTDTLQVSVKVTNTGDRAGKEVVQLYVAPQKSSVFRPVRELKGFDKVELAPGEEKTVTFTLDKRSFAYWNTTLHDWHVDTGAFDIQICADAETVLLSAPVHVESTVRVPVKYDINSIMLDIMQDPKAYAVIQSAMDHATSALGTDGEQGEAASEAITEDMGLAMMKYMPLRGMVSFSGGQMTFDILKQ